MAANRETPQKAKERTLRRKINHLEGCLKLWTIEAQARYINLGGEVISLDIHLDEYKRKLAIHKKQLEKVING